MALLRILVFMVTVFVVYNQECYAINIDAGNMEAMSLDCSDGTKVFGVAGNGFISSSLYIEKDGKLLYANDDFEDIQHIWSVYCSKYATILIGTHGSYYSGSAVTAGSNEIKTKFIVGSRKPAQIKQSKGKLIVNVYGDNRYGKEKTIIKQRVFNKPFTVPSSIKNRDITIINMNTTLPGNPEKSIRLTTIASCYSPIKEDDFTVISYIDESNLSNISIINSYKINDSTSAEYITSIPFTATNSVCIDGSIHLYGKSYKGLRSATVYYDAGKQKFAVKFISHIPATAANTP